MKPTGPAKEKRLELLETRCREQGLPVTVQRRVILAALLDRDDHPTIEQIYGDVKKSIPGVSRTTVYRVLETLIELGIARKTHHFEAFTRFDGNMAHHHHLVCVRCNKVIDVNDPAINKLRLPDMYRAGFDVLDFSVYLEEICPDCKRLNQQQPRAAGRNTRAKTR